MVADEFPKSVSQVIATIPVIVRVTPELIINVRAAVAVLLKLNELAVTLAVTVTVAPGTMITSSAATGAIPPTQVVPRFQFPPAGVLVIVAACAEIAARQMKKATERALTGKNVLRVNHFNW
jgi:hypothetical protein